MIIISNLPSQPFLLDFCHHTRLNKSHAQETVGNTTSKENSNSIFGPTFLNLWIWSFIKILSFDKILEFIPIPIPANTHAHTWPEILKVCTCLKDSNRYNFSKKKMNDLLTGISGSLPYLVRTSVLMSAAIQHKAGRRSEGSDFKSHVCSRNSDFCFIIMAKGSNIAQFLLSEIHRLTAILEIIYKHTSPHCSSLYCPLQILSFLFFFSLSQIEGLWQPRVKPFAQSCWFTLRLFVTC